MKYSVILALALVNCACFVTASGTGRDTEHTSLVAAATYVPRVAPGTQFITGPCQSDADCASSCCGFNSGKCAGRIIAQPITDRRCCTRRSHAITG